MSRVKEVIITSGLPGAGKSTWVRRNTDPYTTEIFSADSFFHSSNGQYKFDPLKLREAHASCLKLFTERLIHLYSSSDNFCEITLVVDNTNTSSWEIAPYYALSEAFDIPVRIVRIKVSPETAFNRNIHGVQKETISRMAERMHENQLPSFWKIEEINMGIV
jgi:predicted kinase